MNTPRRIMLAALLGAAAASGLAAQTAPAGQANYDMETTVYGNLPPLAEMEEGPRVSGIISARKGSRLQITGDDGTVTMVTLHSETEIRTRGGFLGIGNKTLDQSALLNGLPVTIKTSKYAEGLVASEVRFTSDDRMIAAMIRGGTQQQFGEQGAAIQQNAAATEALRGRLGDIDKYNLKGTTNVYFDTGRATLSPAAKNELCAAAQTAGADENSLMLVLGYTDITGSQEVNQTLSEKRAAAVVNHLQQVCKWKPYRMLTPTGMATADPAADNTTAAGRAQNRRVSVNILVSKALDGM
ncbi:OmpA family protein [Erythrobacter neustonensis]|uniref:Cell envelope biogenesis protein OmpA n=1 Tax=Erythrobacter neustonensis TaxID=1112 RepID=A0A192D3V6_9SPHN|nr:OmpA family protein [Erythrobacter neustonensis]ANK13158.1 cell envelope biogenesis protein OmpA [Erythrobacter neustonensis]